MNSIQIFAPGDARVVDLPAPSAGPRDVIVEVRAVTTCPQWDMHLYRGVPMFGDDIAYPYTPGQPGHEMAGVVSDTGSDVSEFRKGDAVVAWRDPGHHAPGCYAQYVRFDPADLLPIPSGADFVSWAPSELAMCVGASFVDITHATSLAGKRVGISGLGGAGLIAAQFAKAEGAARVVGFDMNATRLQHALAFGVDEALNPADTAPGVLNAGQRRALDISVDCVGSKSSAEHLMSTTAQIVAIFGVQREAFAYPRDAGGLKLFGYPGHTRAAADYAKRKMLDGTLRLSGLVTETMRLDEYSRAVSLLEGQQAVKVCFVPNG